MSNSPAIRKRLFKEDGKYGGLGAGAIRSACLWTDQDVWRFLREKHFGAARINLTVNGHTMRHRSGNRDGATGLQKVWYIYRRYDWSIVAIGQRLPQMVYRLAKGDKGHCRSDGNPLPLKIVDALRESGKAPYSEVAMRALRDSHAVGQMYLLRDRSAK